MTIFLKAAINVNIVVFFNQVLQISKILFVQLTKYWKVQSNWTR